MVRVSGSYASVNGGVSEQNAQSRRSGQHWEQTNMISDPVRGLARRHGSILQDEVPIAITNFQTLLANTATNRVVPFIVGDQEYDFIGRTGPEVPGSGVEGAVAFSFVFNKTTSKFIPVSYQAGDPIVNALLSGGISASVAIGRYLFLAGTSILPSITTVDLWGTVGNQQKLVGWVRGGAYSRKFTATLTRADTTTVTASYTTLASSYPILLDTSDIPASDPEYQKKVNDRVNAWNGASNAWIGQAAQSITPENIVLELANDFAAQGAAFVVASGAYLIINHPDYRDLEMTDSGDDTLVRAVANTVENVDLVSSRHWDGKVVRVIPKGSSGDPVYLRAALKGDGVFGSFGEVVWTESPGMVMTPQSVFCIGTVEGGTFFLGGSPAGLAAQTGLAVPGYEANKVGDAVSAPIPEFFGNRIDYLGTFQDRLVIGTGSELFFSRPGDYFNWFRSSVLTIQDDDPVGVLALSPKDDIIKFSVLYDRSLYLFGQNYQYMVSGRAVLTPTNKSLMIVSAYEDATTAPVQASGNFVYYSKYTGQPGRESSSLHQVQPGNVQDGTVVYAASQQLDTYLQGKPVEVVTLTDPNMVLMRTTADRSKVYLYSYLDNPNNNERLFDSWSNWSWLPEVGHCVGINRFSSDILVYMVKQGVDRTGAPMVWVSCEKFIRDSDLSDYPYLDSLRPLGSYTSPSATTSLSPASPSPEKGGVAIQRGPVEQFLGDSLLNLTRFEEVYGGLLGQTWVGYNYPAFVTPTNPYARDRNDQAILGGRLTVSKVTVAVTDTGAMKCTVEQRGVTRMGLDFTGRVLGDPIDQVGRQPIITTGLTAYIGGEARECKYTLAAVRWLPLTINSIEWQGQHFFNTRRA